MTNPEQLLARLEEIDRRAAAASHGPWRAIVEGRDHTSGDDFIRTRGVDDRGPDMYVSLSTHDETAPAGSADLDFIAHARQDVPELVAALRVAVAEPAETPTDIEFLQRWYAAQCDSEWEHAFGMSIGNIDNPGWRVTINLEDTDLADKDVPPQKVERSTDDWISVWKQDLFFQAAGGPLNLVEMLAAFRSFAETVE